MKNSAKRFGLTSAVAIVGSSFALVPPVHAADLGCGQVVTTSIVLSNDIGPCLLNSDGLIVRGSNITVDLGGHRIIGGGADPNSNDQVGVRLDHVSGVTLTNGVVSDFFAGIADVGGATNTITGITAIHNIGNGFTHYGDGINLDGANNDTVKGNAVIGNGPYAGINMIDAASHNLISNNFVGDNNVITPKSVRFPIAAQQDSGISNDTGASFNVIDGNVVLRSGFFGISLAGSTQPTPTEAETATNNVVRDSGNYGINAGTARNGHLVARNVIENNGFEQYGPSLAPGADGGVATCGTCFGPGTFTTIRDNIIQANNGPGVALLFNGFQTTGGTGMFGTFPPIPYTAPRSNLVQHNVVRNNTGDGIFIECDKLYDANFNSVCLPSSPPHQGIRVLNNNTANNGGAEAGVSAWDLHDQNPNCDHNIWLNNSFVTANPPCTTAQSG